jgi:hypothetical protein
MTNKAKRNWTPSVRFRNGSLLIWAQMFAVMALSCVSVFAANGTLDYSSGWYPAGTNLTVTASPVDVYSQFDHWSGDTNAASVVDNTLTMASLTGSKTITAHFVDATTASNQVPYTWLHTLSNGWTTAEEFEAAATNDYDGDGFTTAQEYWSGTDPFSDASYLHISNVGFANGNVRLLWNHARVDSNIPPLCVQVSSDLVNGNWQDASVNTNTPIDGLNTWEEPYAGPRFYRLIVPPAP